VPDQKNFLRSGKSKMKLFSLLFKLCLPTYLSMNILATLSFRVHQFSPLVYSCSNCPNLFLTSKHSTSTMLGCQNKQENATFELERIPSGKKCDISERRGSMCLWKELDRGRILELSRGTHVNGGYEGTKKIGGGSKERSMVEDLKGDVVCEHVVGVNLYLHDTLTMLSG
jgi:hypothetical protein